MGRLSPPESVTGFSIKFIGDWTVLQIMSEDLGELGLTQHNCSLNSFLCKGCFTMVRQILEIREEKESTGRTPLPSNPLWRSGQLVIYRHC